tara:strand:+ start:358 stop:1458 length:1101 start_codon:yes stop_codon:yes gene_type:complete
MRAIVYSHRDKEGVKEVELNQPQVRPKTNTHVLVKVFYCGVNPVDAKYNVGDKLPHWLNSLGKLSMDGRGVGYDFSGIILETPKNDPNCPFSAGDEIFGTMPPTIGSFREFILAPIDQIALKPKSLELREAAAIPLSGLTSLQALKYDFNQKTGNIILIIGASGGVGHLSVQVAKKMGLKVVAICSEENKSFVSDLGADEVIDYKKGNEEILVKLRESIVLLKNPDELNGKKSLTFHMVFDCVTSLSKEDRAYDYKNLILKNNLINELSSYVAIGGEFTDWLKAGIKRRMGFNLFKKNQELFWVRFPQSAPFLEELKNDFIDCEENLKLRPRIAKELPFSISGVREAFQLMNKRRTVGKIVLKVSD